MKVLIALEGPVAEGPNVWANSLYYYIASQFHNPGKDIINQVKTTNFKSLIKAIFSIRKYDIFHFYSQSYGAALLFLLCKILGKKIIFTMHGNMTIESKYKPIPIRWLWIPAHLFVMKNVDVVTYPSQYLKSSMSEYFKSKKQQKKYKFSHHVIPNGTLVGEYPVKQVNSRVNRLKEIKKGSSQLKILMLTSFYFEPKSKGIETLKETIEILNNQGIKTQVKIGGKGPMLEHYKQKFHNSDVSFLGYCDDKKELEWADIYVHLSYLDNQPLAILKAGAVGLPSVASNIGGIPEIYSFSSKDMVWGLTPNKPNIVANKIMDLISDEKFYLETSKKQYSNIKKNFSMATVGNNFWDLYTNIYRKN